MSPGPAPPLLADWFTWPFVAAVILVALIWYAIWVIRAIKQDRLDTMPDPQPEEPHTCQIGDCPRPGTNTYDRHPSGVLHVCDMHATRIQRWTGPPTNRPAEHVYDQDMDGTDLQQWEAEL